MTQLSEQFGYWKRVGVKRKLHREAISKMVEIAAVIAKFGFDMPDPRTAIRDFATEKQLKALDKRDTRPEPELRTC